MIFLGIETSCDDTSVAVVADGKDILANVVASQDEYHRKFGGVVPEIAARKHIEHVLPVIRHCLTQAAVDMAEITAIAVTHRPGLVGSLIVGLTAAKTLSLMYNKPLIGIHHLQAHAYAAVFAGLDFSLPHLALVASGGHTSLLYHHDDHMELIGRTVDDAAGEAYDKIAKFLGLGYPGGPIIDRLAAFGNPDIVQFPRPMLKHSNFNFSFSGLKTAVMYYMHHHPHTSPEDLSAAFQDAVTDVLVSKTLKAAEILDIRNLSVVGGVAANNGLRARFRERTAGTGINLYIPEPKLCTDNAAMVAGLAWVKWNRQASSDLHLAVEANAGLELKHIPFE